MCLLFKIKVTNSANIPYHEIANGIAAAEFEVNEKYLKRISRILKAGP